MTDFHLEDWNEGYAAFSAHEAGEAAWLYLLVPFVQKPPESLSLAQAWALVPPWALLVRASQWDFGKESPSAAAAKLGLGQLSPGGLALAWLTDGAGYQTLNVTSAAGNRQVLAKTPL